MPTGIELHYGFAHGIDGFDAALTESLGLRPIVLQEGTIDYCPEVQSRPYLKAANRRGEFKIARYDDPDPIVARLDRALHGAHTRALQSVGFANIRESGFAGEVGETGYTTADTPCGVRTFAPWTLRVYYDARELNEALKDATLSVAVSGRYRPVFADWRDPHGTLSPMVFDTDLQHMQAAAKHYIVQALPCFADAYWIVKEIFY